MSTARKKGGFTLTELLIVVAIIAVLGSIAYPSYLEQVRTSRRAEGQGLLLETAQSLEKCKALYGTYNAVVNGNTLCSTVPRITGSSYVESAEKFYRVSDTGGGVTAATFALEAVPIDSDPECGILILKHDGDQCINASGTELCTSVNSEDANKCW